MSKARVSRFGEKPKPTVESGRKRWLFYVYWLCLGISTPACPDCVSHYLCRLMNQSNQNIKIAFIEASWHHDIVEQARIGFTEEMLRADINANQIDVFAVPGSLEIPLQCKLLAKTGKYNLIVASGLIVDSNIYRHDFVAATVLDAMMQVQLDTETPIMSVVLTPHLFSEAQEHHDFFFSHFYKKGIEAAKSSLQTIESIRAINEPRLSKVS
ncbi:MAG: 6,7-dimethyl-8-ribityllumazine synthase [Gammaproteobacteria bacterium]